MNNRILRTVCAILAATGAVSAPPAAAKEPRCITRVQLGSLVHVILPVIVDAALTRCGSLLPPGAYLVRAATKLRADFPIVTAGDPAAARRALEGFAGKTLPPGSDAIAAKILTETMTERIGLTRLTVGQCRDVSDVLEPLDALPAAQLERLIVAIFAVVGRDGRSMRVCDDPATFPAR